MRRLDVMLVSGGAHVHGDVVGMVSFEVSNAAEFVVANLGPPEPNGCGHEDCERFPMMARDCARESFRRSVLVGSFRTCAGIMMLALAALGCSGADFSSDFNFDKDGGASSTGSLSSGSSPSSGSGSSSTSASGGTGAGSQSTSSSAGGSPTSTSSGANSGGSASSGSGTSTASGSGGSGGTSDPCGPDNCSGCCDASGDCLQGDANAACGDGGEACSACEDACGWEPPDFPVSSCSSGPGLKHAACEAHACKVMSGECCPVGVGWYCETSTATCEHS